MEPPPLKNDCFALPPGVHWTPVDEAHAHLAAALAPVTASEVLPLDACDGRFLAEPITAVRANPPAANAAVDGYGFAASTLPANDGTVILPLGEGRAAAGAPYPGTVPPGQALRILTGAPLPEGVDTVILEEDTTAEAGRIAFRGPVKARSNTRRAGEDVDVGAVLFEAGHRIRPQDLALLAATGAHTPLVHRPLRVGVLSTGDEVRPVGEPLADGEITDANRPMLLALIRRWGFDPVDLGHVSDNRAALQERLSDGAARTDMMLTSGGASAGDEDHVSALLNETGTMGLWRIALKPGRPLALGLWQGRPVFGLPGNPVAAFVCTLLFAEPAMRRLAGGPWRLPAGHLVPAAFSKAKKPGRREYLRARLGSNGAEVFRSEGSGRISGLSWSDGLVELPDHALDVTPGTMVRYIPYTAFGA